MKSLVTALFLVPVLAFAPPAAADGVPFARESPAPAAAVVPARMALAGELYGSTPPMSAIRLNLGREALLVQAVSGEVCGNAVGCPTAILVRQGTSWQAVWTGVSFGHGSVLASNHAGLKDISLGSAHGQRLLAYDGSSYQEPAAR